MLIRVECTPGDQHEAVPNRIFFGRRVVDAREVLDRWYGKNYRYFKIRSDDGIYIVRHDEATQEWDFVMFERPANASAARH